MPKAIIDSVRGVNQTAGTGLVVAGMPIDHYGDGVTYVHGGTIPATTDVALVAATQGVKTEINLANGTHIGAQKTIIITSIGGGNKLQLHGAAGAGAPVANIDGDADYPDAVTAGDVFHCIYVATGKWFVSR